MLKSEYIYNFPNRSKEQKLFADEFVRISQTIPNTFLSNSEYSIRTTFSNWMRCDFIAYQNNIYIIRFNRGAWIARNHPILWAIFDEIQLVISKIYIYNLWDFENKAIAKIMQQIDKMPKWIKYNS